MDDHKSKRYYSDLPDKEKFKDSVFDTEGLEYSATLTGKLWKDYDWIIGRYPCIARRLVDQTNFVRAQDPGLTFSTGLSLSIKYFMDAYKSGEGRGNPQYNPKVGTVGST